MAALDVISGSARWSVDCSDCLPWLRSLPDGCVSLTVFSPPYERARTYGVDFSLAGQDWVDWLAERIVEMARITNGLVVCNAAGQVRDRRYSPVVEWLCADLTRKHGLVCGPAPYVYFRFGIPGSGGDQYHRRDWEPVYCFCRPDRLPLAWSVNTAEGHPPKWAPGGEMSNRLSDGARVNQWGRCGGHESSGTRGAHGKRQRKSRPSHEPVQSKAERQAEGEVGLFGEIHPAPSAHKNAHGVRTDTPIGSRSTGMKDANRETYRAGRKVMSRQREGQHSQESTEYSQPTLANPGNVVRERYDAESVRQLLEQYVTREIDAGDVIRCLVGGGQMGSPLAHMNEAPMPERLAEFFVRSYAPPDGIVCDPFAGSGTTGAVSLRHGRRFVGCDLRQSQVDLASKRLGQETPGLFGGEE